MSKTLVQLIVVLAIAGVVGFAGYQYYLNQQNQLPAGIASGNGRIEAKQIDVAARESLRVKEILVDEGDIVQPGQVVIRMDTSTLDAQLEQAKAEQLTAEEKVAVNKATIVQKKSEVKLAETELVRYKKLREKNATSQQDVDRHQTALEVSQAAVDKENASLRTSEQEVKVAAAQVATIQTRIDDATLTSPCRGRVLFRLTEKGEVLQPGGPALTIVNLEDVYMEIYLPAAQAGKIKIGTEGRLTVDHVPGKSAAAKVTFVSPEAQFTPKQVETKSERDKLMFRVKLQAPQELVQAIIERIKTGVRGVGYVKLDDSTPWPASLSDVVKPEDFAKQVEAEAPKDSADVKAAEKSKKLQEKEAAKGEEANTEEAATSDTTTEEQKTDEGNTESSPAKSGDEEEAKSDTP
jgi:HlyD family secretion protein